MKICRERENMCILSIKIIYRHNGQINYAIYNAIQLIIADQGSIFKKLTGYKRNIFYELFSKETAKLIDVMLIVRSYSFILKIYFYILKTHAVHFYVIPWSLVTCNKKRTV